jgi:signal transduction histidine kinase
VRLPIRLRLTIAYAVTAALVSVLAAAIFANQVREALLGSVDAELAASAGPIADAVGQSPPTEGSVGPRDPLLQVYDPRGVVVESSASLDGEELLGPTERSAARAASQSFTVHLQDDTRVLAVPVRRADGTWLVAVASSLAPQYAVIADVAGDLLRGAAVIAVLGAVGAWLLAGAALRPVERMRREVALMSVRDPASSLSVPATRDELTALANTMNELLRRLHEGLRRERRLVSDAAHELRTPLSILRTELELAGRPGRSRAELQDAISSSSAEVSRLVALADDLLLLARTDEGVPLDRQPGQAIEPILRDTVRATAAVAAARRIGIRVDVTSGLLAEIDPRRVRQAVDNLLSNALRHAPPESEVRIAAHDDAGNVVIEVADRGPGFPPDFLPHAFERFRRADTGRGREHGGSGLGLAVVRAIALAHGGQVTASNQEAGGAVIRIVLPRLHANETGREQVRNGAGTRLTG